MKNGGGGGGEGGADGQVRTLLGINEDWFSCMLISTSRLTGRRITTNCIWHRDEVSGKTQTTKATDFMFNNNVDIKGKRRAGYNFSSTCCGLDILCPCCSQCTIFLPSIRGYGEPPGRETHPDAGAS